MKDDDLELDVWVLFLILLFLIFIFLLFSNSGIILKGGISFFRLRLFIIILEFSLSSVIELLIFLFFLN